jgi:hypothetical protein
MAIPVRAERRVKKGDRMRALVPWLRRRALHSCLVLGVLIGALPGTAGAADNITLQNIVFQIGAATYRLPQVEFVGPNLDREQLSALFDQNTREDAPKRLKALTATAVNIPELVAELSLPDGRQTVIIRGLSLQNVAAGRATRVSGSGLTSEGDLVALASVGAIAMTDFDFGRAADLYTAQSPTHDKDSDPIVGALDLNLIDIRTRKGSTVHADRFSISGVRALPAGADADSSDARHYISGVGTASLAGVTADVASDEVGERLKIAVGNATLATEHPYNGLPTDISFTVDDLAVAIPEGAQATTARDLRDMGYEALRGSMQFTASWNEAANQMVGDLTLRMRDAGSIAVRATVGNVTKEAFSSTPAIAEAAGSKATVKALAVSVSDGGLFERLIANEARKQGRSRAEIRSEFAAQSEDVVASLFGAFPEVVDVRKAVLDFIQHPGELEIAVKTRSPAGMTWADLIAALATPAVIADKLILTVFPK